MAKPNLRLYDMIGYNEIRFANTIRFGMIIYIYIYIYAIISGYPLVYAVWVTFAYFVLGKL